MLITIAIVSQRAVALKPIELDHITAAALPLAGGAASLMAQAIDPQPGQVVLVNGASGGVGRYAVQLLSRRGVTVVATATADDADRMRELGAAQVVDFTAGPVAEQVLALYPDGIDGLINLVGWTLDAVPVDALRAGAAVSSTTQVPDADAIAARGLTGGGIMASPTSDVFGPLAESAARGDLHVDVFRVVALHEALDGLAELASGRSRGKIVVDLTR